MLIVKIDRIHAQPSQAALAGLADIFRFATDAPGVGILWIANNTEFRSQHNLVATASDGLANEFFVGKRSIDVGSIEKSYAEFQGPVNRSQRFMVVAPAVELRHTHAAQAHGGHCGAVASQFAGFHHCLLIEKFRSVAGGTLISIPVHRCARGWEGVTILIRRRMRTSSSF